MILKSFFTLPVIVLGGLLLGGLLFGVTASADLKGNCSEASSFAMQFLKLENAGERLKANAKIFSLTTDAEDAVWDTAWVVSGYQIESCDADGKEVTVKVSYRIIGSISSNEQGFPVFSESAKSEAVAYHIVRRQHRWMIYEISGVRPHISLPAAIDAVNEIAERNSFDPGYDKSAKKAIAVMKSTSSPDRLPASADEVR